MRVKEEHGMKKSEKSVGISDKLGYMLGNLYFTLLSLSFTVQLSFVI